MSSTALAAAPPQKRKLGDGGGGLGGVGDAGGGGGDDDPSFPDLTPAECMGLFHQGKYTGDAQCFLDCAAGCARLLKRQAGDADLRRLSARCNVQVGMLCDDDADAAR
jgi:hypothetical protein